MLDKDRIKKVLVITLSNLGDVVLTTPVVEVLLREFPEAKIDVMVGPNGAEIFRKHPKISELITYDKFKPFPDKIKLIRELRERQYSLIVDLRNTLLPYLIGAPYRSLPFNKFSRHIAHKKDIHLWKLKTLGINISNPPYCIYIDDSDREYVNNALKNLPPGKIVAINTGAKSHLKRWTKEGFAYLIDKIKNDEGANIIMIGSPEDVETSSSILKQVKADVVNLVGKTTVRQLVALLEKADFLITNDSAPLHIASILDKKVLAIFGPTDPKEYGSFNKGCAALQKPLVCVPCERAHCAFDYECMRFLKKERVFEAAKAMLNGKEPDMHEPKRILLIRTDRIGDVALSTPAIKAAYEAYSNSFIAFAVQPYAKDIVEGNPYLDEVIIFDKEKAHKGVRGMLKFAQTLKEKKFNIAIVLHPTNRVHIAIFLAGIPERVGYNKKMGFLLTKKIPHTKQFGRKHELEYTLDVLRAGGIEPKDNKPFMHIDEKAESRIEELLSSKGVAGDDLIVAIHPGASCPSKRWDAAKFAGLADEIMETFNTKVIIVAGPKDVTLGNKVSSLIKHNTVNLSGALSVKELASLLKRCTLFISNDSGPVHIAVAVGTPVVSIFGRNEKGLSPVRWRPLGKDDIVIHKDVGCKECLAHDCKINFKCLETIKVNEVLDAVRKFKDRLEK